MQLEVASLDKAVSNFWAYLSIRARARYSLHAAGDTNTALNKTDFV
jgi:hypothetical protein